MRENLENFDPKRGYPHSRQFTGTMREKRLDKIERIARNRERTWLLITLFIVVSIISLVIYFPQNTKVILGGVMLVPLSIAIIRYDRACKERKENQRNIMSYLEIEADGKLRKSAEVGLSQFYEKHQDSWLGKNINFLERKKSS